MLKLFFACFPFVAAMDGVFASSVCDAGVSAKVLERLQMAESALRSGGSALAMEVSESAASAGWARVGSHDAPGHNAFAAVLLGFEPPPLPAADVPGPTLTPLPVVKSEATDKPDVSGSGPPVLGPTPAQASKDQAASRARSQRKRHNKASSSESVTPTPDFGRDTSSGTSDSSTPAPKPAAVPPAPSDPAAVPPPAAPARDGQPAKRSKRHRAPKFAPRNVPPSSDEDTEAGGRARDADPPAPARVPPPPPPAAERAARANIKLREAPKASSARGGRSPGPAAGRTRESTASRGHSRARTVSRARSRGPANMEPSTARGPAPANVDEAMTCESLCGVPLEKDAVHAFDCSVCGWFWDGVSHPPQKHWYCPQCRVIYCRKCCRAGHRAVVRAGYRNR